MRSRTAGEDTILGAAVRNNYIMVEVQDAAAAWIDLTDLSSLNWVLGVTWGELLDQPVAEARVTLRRDQGVLSLSPFRGDSSLNTGGALIDAGRGLRISTATTAAGVAAVGGDWKLKFNGFTDVVDWSKPEIELIARDLGSYLVDRWVEEETEYGSGAGIAMETVMQSILTDWAPGVTLYTPSTPGFLITSFTIDEQSVMAAIQTLAASIGWVVGYEWDDGTSAFRLTLEEPDRAKTTPDWTFAASRYFDVTQLKIDREPVRNAGQLWYPDTAAADRLMVDAVDTTSAARFGRRWFRINEADDSPINTAAEAQDLIDAAISDLALPYAEQEIELPYFWPGEKRDLYRFSANGIHYNANQDLAVVAISHEFRERVERTRIQVRGKPAGFYLGWRSRGSTVLDTIATGYAKLDVHPTTGLVSLTVGSTDPDTDRAYWGVSVAGYPTVTTASTMIDRAAMPYDASTGLALTSGQKAYLVVRFYNDVYGFGEEVRDVVPFTVSKRAPATSIELTESVGSGTATVTIADPDLLLTAVEFQKKTGSGSFGGSWLTTWDGSTGTVGTDAAIIRSEAVALDAKHNSEIMVRVAYTLGASPFVSIFPLTFGITFGARITGFTVGFTATNAVEISDIIGDPDTANIYATVTVDGSTPADPTSAVNDGSLAGNIGKITTAIIAASGQTAKVKLRGYTSTPAAGPVYEGQALFSVAEPPRLQPRAVLSANQDTADVYCLVTTRSAEAVRLHYRDDEASGASATWGLVVSGSDSTARYAASGTELGPSDWFHNGTTFAQKLNDIVLVRDQIERIFLQGEGQTSGSKTSWLPFAIDVKGQPWLESVSLEWDDVADQLKCTVRGGARTQSVVIIFDDDPAFGSVASTTTASLLDGDSYMQPLSLSGSSRDKMWYVRVNPYNAASGTGLVGAPQVASCYVTGNVLKTIRVPCGAFDPSVGTQTSWQKDSSLRDTSASGSGTYYAPVLFPAGASVTLTGMRLRADRIVTDEIVQVVLKRVEDSGSFTTLATCTHTGTVWSTTSTTSFTETTVGRTYVLEAYLQNYLVIGGAQLAWVEIDYTMADYGTAL